MADNLKPRSGVITDGPDRAPTRAMLKAAGFTDEDLRRPIIGVANTWIEIGPCNYHLRRLAAKVKEGIRAAGGTPMEFNTVSISDGISMGAEGMKCSLISREVIADSIELVARGNHFDGLVCFSGCDKTNPGVVMALARLDIPGLALYGGSIAPGHLGDKDLTIQDVFEAVGAYASKRIDAEQFLAVENAACPGAGACGGQFTANTMSTVMEFLGISPMGSNGIPATVAEKDEAAFNAGKLVMDLLRARFAPVEDSHPQVDRERDRIGGRHRRFDQRGVAFARHRARSGGRTEHRRLRPDQRAHAADRRSQARRTIRRQRSLPSRRHSTGRQTFDRCRIDSWRYDHGDRQDPRRGGADDQGNRRTRSGAADDQSAQGDRRLGDSQRQSGAGRLRGQSRRP